MRTSGIVRIAPAQKSLVISISSGFAASTETVFGSRAIPHFGPYPGESLTTSGCIGHVHSVLVTGNKGTSGSRAIPQMGQAPGLSCTISGSIGHVYFVTLSVPFAVRHHQRKRWNRLLLIYISGFWSNLSLQ